MHFYPARAAARAPWLLALSAAIVLIALGSASVARADDTHVVQRGETLSSIALRYGVTVRQLADLNSITNANLIFAGSTLKVTAPSTEQAESSERAFHVVSFGETLSAIANRFGFSLGSLVAANNLTNPNLIYPGQQIAFPGPGGNAPSPTYDPQAVIRAAATEWGIDPSLLLALSWQESGWQQHVVSWAGAVGLMQLMPMTAAWVQDYLMGENLDWRTDPGHNARIGAAYLAHLLRLSGGDSYTALASYYQGWYSVQTYGIFGETHQYVRNVLYFAERF